MYETLDGNKYSSEHEAKKHIEKIYADLLLDIGRKLANQNYTNVTDYVDRNLQRFIQLARIKENMTLEIDLDDAE